jgi:hypothetical protein
MNAWMVRLRARVEALKGSARFELMADGERLCFVVD